MALASFLLFLQAADVAVAVLIAELDHDDAETRRKARVELARIGKPALPALREAHASSPSLEVRDASARVIDVILARIREDFILSHATAPKHFSCGGLFFHTPLESRQRLKDLSPWFPECELLAGGFTCMHRVQRCGGTWILGLSREDGEIFTIRLQIGGKGGLELGDPGTLSRHLKPARDAAEAGLLARLLAESSSDPALTQAPGLRKLAFPDLAFEFDAEGRLVRISKGE
jgi:hypothetical protein